MSPLLVKAYSALSFLLSQKVNKRIVVFESDDWGSARMPNREAYLNSLKNGYPVDKDIYSKFDCLESSEDLQDLFDLISGFKDSNSNHPIFTTNFLVTNPDYEEIRNQGYSQYYYQALDETYLNGQNTAKNIELLKVAKNEHLISIQSHGREHLNVSRYMNDLIINDAKAHFSLKNNMPGIVFKNGQNIISNDYVVALEHNNDHDLSEKGIIIKDGLKLFEKIFGFNAESFIACNYVWHPNLEQQLNEAGIKFIQGIPVQFIPKGQYKGFNYKFHYTSQTNNLNQIFIVRNAHFEPIMGGEQALNACLKRIERAFDLNTPAIISTHRINYVSGLDKQNRQNGLKYLNTLLNSILKTWPDVIFMSSVELGYLLQNKKGNSF
jgi:hypothetical protein